MQTVFWGKLSFPADFYYSSFLAQSWWRVARFQSSRAPKKASQAGVFAGAAVPSPQNPRSIHKVPISMHGCSRKVPFDGVAMTRVSVLGRFDVKWGRVCAE